MNYAQFFNSTIRLSIPIIYIAMGEIFALKVNIFNLALDAFALFGAFFSIVGALYTESVLGGIIFGVILTIIVAFIYSLFVLELKVNEIVASIAFIILASGLTRFLMFPIFGTRGRYTLPTSLALNTIHFKFLEYIPFVGEILNDQTILAYLALVVPFIIYFFFSKTKIGLGMRAIGQNTDAALVSGIKVKQIRYIALALNGLFCGLAGAQLALSINMFNVGMTGGRGFMALATLIMTGYKPLLTFLACLLFGFSISLSNVLSSSGYPSQLIQMIPYLLALLIVILPPIISSLIKEYRKSRSEKEIISQYLK